MRDRYAVIIAEETGELGDKTSFLRLQDSVITMCKNYEDAKAHAVSGPADGIILIMKVVSRADVVIEFDEFDAPPKPVSVK